MIGQVINGFLIEKKLHESSTGTVYCAKDTMLDVPKAIKIVHPHLAQNDVMRQRFKLALQSWAKLDYPGFVPIYSAIDTDNFMGFIMNYVEGRALATIVKEQGKLGISQSIDYFLQVAKALAFAHQRKIIHRKLSTRNILVCKDESVKVVGLGSLRDCDTGKITPPNVCIGKPQYMAPEQFAGNYTDKTDQYALGVILYEMVTGQRPFIAPNLRSLYQLHAQKMPESPQKLNAEIKPELAEAILKMLAKKPENRFPNLESVIETILMATDRLDIADDVSVQSLMYRGRHALERRKLENAVYFFNKILSIYGKDTPHYQEAMEKRQEAARLFKEEEDIREIRDLFIEALVHFDEEDVPGTREYVIKILKIMRHYPTSSRVRGVRMDIAREMPEILAEASNWLEQGIEEGKGLTARAHQLAQEGHYEEAIDLFDQALEHDPQNVEALQHKTNTQKRRKIALVARCYCNAQAAFKQKDYTQAISLLEKVLQLDDHHQNARKYLGMALEEQERQKKLRADVDKNYREGLDLYEKWLYGEAMAKFDVVLKLDPSHSEAEHFLEATRLRLDDDTKMEEIGLFYQNGVTFYENRKWREAIACFNRVLKEIPTHKKAMDYKKLAEDAIGRDELWDKTFAEAVQFFNRNLYGEALELLGQLEKIDANNPEVRRYQRLCQELNINQNGVD